MSTLLARTPAMPSLLDDDDFGFPGSFLDADTWSFPARMFNAPFFRHGNMPAVNIKDNVKSFEMEFAVPGFKKEDLKVRVEDNVLTISSEHEKEEKEEKEGYTRREFSYRSFQRTFQLPDNADGENVKANYEDGVLKLTIPKTKALPEKRGKEVRIA